MTPRIGEWSPLIPPPLTQIYPDEPVQPVKCRSDHFIQSVSLVRWSMRGAEHPSDSTGKPRPSSSSSTTSSSTAETARLVTFLMELATHSPGSSWVFFLILIYPRPFYPELSSDSSRLSPSPELLSCYNCPVPHKPEGILAALQGTLFAGLLY
jgi:hypothetical protein